MGHPIAFFITWTTYGTWLPGDPRGSFDREGIYIVPDERRRQAAEELMTEDMVHLTPEERAIVDAVIVQHCTIRGWVLHARNARTNHVHVVVSAPVDGERVRAELKKWASVRLSEHAGLPASTGSDGARRWWTEKGNIEEVWDDRHLNASIIYVTEAQ
jgi:REP element-mobilizing transposase RayT